MGVPFGIWIFSTQDTKNEWNKECYKIYWDNDKYQNNY